MYRVTSINKSFKSGHNKINVLKDLSLELPDKGLVVLFGKSGSGKSTLLNILGGLDSVDSGKLVIANNFENNNSLGLNDFSKYNTKQWDEFRNNHIGYIFQNYNLLGKLSVFDNVALSLKICGIKDPTVIKEKVDYVLDSLGMLPYKRKKAMQLSGGQMQRVAIARAIVKNPSIILADEPTGNLDTNNTFEIMNILKNISLDKLVILVTHDVDIARTYSDLVIEMVDGRISRQGTNTSSSGQKNYHDHTIYLQDLQSNNLETEQGNITLYSDNSLSEIPKIKLIISNRQLFIETKDYKVNILNDQSAYQIKDGSLKDEEEVFQSKVMFDNTKLEVQKSNKAATIISWKKAIKNGYLKFSQKKPHRLLLTAFIYSGAMFASIMVFFVGILFSSIKDSYFHETNSIELYTPTRLEITELEELSNQGIKFYDGIRVNFYPANKVYLDQVGYADYSVTINTNRASRLKSSDLTSGHLPTSEEEIVLSEKNIKLFLEGYKTFQLSASPNIVGIWNKAQFLQTSFYLTDTSNNSNNGYFENKEFKIVGITKNDHPYIYLQDSIFERLTLQNYIKYSSITRLYSNPNIEPQSVTGKEQNYTNGYDKNIRIGLYNNQTLSSTSSQPLNQNEILLSRTNYERYLNYLKTTESFSGTTINGLSYYIEGDRYVIRGFFIDDLEFDVLLHSKGYSSLLLKAANYYVSSKFDGALYLDNKQVYDYNCYADSTINLDTILEGQPKITGHETHEQLLKGQSVKNTPGLIPIILVSFIMSGIPIIGFYFIMRSSLMTRINEIKIQRAIGVRKHEIMRSFLVELLLIITISSALSYVVCVYLLGLLPGDIFGMVGITINASFPIYIIGLLFIYGSEILLGMLPIFLTLNKRPSNLLAKYDM